jgi:tetratricopeptide (TPR) repeat protein
MTATMRRSLWMSAALVAVLACAGFPGRSAWIALESPHLEVWSASGEEPARRFAERLERVRQISARFFPQREDAPRVRVLLLDSRAYAPLAPGGEAAFRLATPEGAFVVVDARADAALAAAQHAFAHLLMGQRAEWRYPAWFEEGMAVFLGALQPSAERVELGRPPTEIAEQLALGTPLGLRRLLVQSGGELWAESVQATFRAQSWVLVHFLLLGQHAGFPDRLEALQGYLAAVELGAAPEQAFPEAFGLGIEAFEEELRRYLERIRYYTTPLAQDPIALEPARALPRVDVEVGLAQLDLALGSRRWPDARARLERARRLDPASARIQAELGRALAYLGDPAAEALVRGALERGDDDAVVQRLAGDARLGADDGDAAAARALYERSIALDASPGAAHAGLARTYRSEPDPEPGIRAALAARERLGLVRSVELTLAELLERRGSTRTASVIAAHARATPHAAPAPDERPGEGTPAVGAAAADPYLGVQLELRSPRPDARVRSVVAITEVAGRAGIGEPPHDYAVVLGETTLPEEQLFDPDRPESGLLGLLGDPRHKLVRVLDMELETARALTERIDGDRDRAAVLTFAEAATLHAELGSRSDALEVLGGVELPGKLEFNRIFRSGVVRRNVGISPRIGRNGAGLPDAGGIENLDDLGPQKEPGANLTAAIRAALDALFRDARPQERRRRSILLISDGKLRPNSLAERVQVLRAAEQARLYGVVIHAVTIGRSSLSANDVIARAAEVSGGKSVLVRKSGQAVASLAREPLRGLSAVRIANRTTGQPARAQRIFVDGSFDGFVPLTPGPNRIEIAVTFADGRTSLLEREVVYERPSEPTAAEQREGEETLEALRERGIETELSREATEPQPGQKDLDIRPEETDPPAPR